MSSSPSVDGSLFTEGGLIYKGSYANDREVI